MFRRLFSTQRSSCKRSVTAACIAVALATTTTTAAKSSGITKVTFSGTIAALPNGTNSWEGFTTNNPLTNKFSMTFTFNPNYSGANNCGNADLGSKYTWNDSGCGEDLFTSIVFTNSLGTYSQYSNAGLSMQSYDSSANIADGNPFFIGTNLADSSGNSGIFKGEIPLSGFEILPGIFSYQFVNSYLQPYINISSTLPTPSDFLQFYYSSSYYRDYSIAALTTNPTPEPPVANVYFFGEGSPLQFTLTGMDIVTPIPAPLPLLGASSALYFSRKLRRRIYASLPDHN